MAFTVDHAKRMRAAYKKAGKRTVQIGHQWTSTGAVASFLQPGKRRNENAAALASIAEPFAETAGRSAGASRFDGAALLEQA